jgi:hypothetical protein
MASKRKQRNNAAQSKFTWAQAARDIVVTSMNRGQLPILGVLAVVFLMVWRMPEGDVSKLVFSVVSHLKDGDLWGYALSLVLAGGWYSYAKNMRKKFSVECERIGREKSALQGKLAGTNYRSSDQS